MYGAVSPAAALWASAPVMQSGATTIDNRTYFSVTQQAGENGEALAQRVVQIMTQDYVDVNGMKR